MDQGQRAITIDEVPLDWCCRPGVKLDFRHFPDGYVVTADDVEAELTRIGHKLEPLDIVLVNTAAVKALGNPNFVRNRPTQVWRTLIRRELLSNDQSRSSLINRSYPPLAK
jgi:kynurenine formamidase